MNQDDIGALIEVMRTEIVRQSESDDPDRPWIEVHGDRIKIDGDLDLVALAQRIASASSCYRTE